jgi:very-short-patch-repair endonuclease
MMPKPPEQLRLRPHRVSAELLQRARAMRQEPAPAEQKLWWCLRDRRLNGFKFRRQAPVLTYVPDFYCADCKLIVELDGDSHDGREQYDEKRTRELANQGYRVVRFVNTDIYDHLDAVLEANLAECEAIDAERKGKSPHTNHHP